MKRWFASVWSFAACLLVSALFAKGCGDPLVGLDCAKGSILCAGACIDQDSDELNCGACGTVCASDEMCIASECTTDFDGGSTGPSDGGLDGGSGRRDGGDAASEGWADVELPPLCSDDPQADCVCDLGQLQCQGTCINANVDTFNCGACGNNCNATPPPSGQYFCVDGRCDLNCDAPLTVCGNRCVDLQTDVLNCGFCDLECQSGLCDLGQCLDRIAGHVIVIGHDMQSALPAVRRVAGNAMFLPAKTRVRMLIYDAKSLPGQRAGVDAAIAEVQQVTGRMSVRTDVTDIAQVPLQLSQSDVFVVVTQENATDAELIAAGELWGRALQTFVARGGVIVLFDAGSTNGGTYQILAEAGMFTVNQRVPLTPRVVNVVAPGDALASFVPAMYLGPNNTAGFDTSETTVVVRDNMTGLPVVVHIAR